VKLERKKKSGSLANEQGDTLVAVLLAGLLLGGAALGASAIVKFMRSQSEFSHVTGTAIAIESAIVSSLQRPEVYSDAAAEAMRRGESPASLELKMQKDGAPLVVASVSNDRSFNEQGAPCVGNDCAVKVQLALACEISLCRAAYRIEFNATKIKPALPALGASVWPPLPADFTQVINFDLYRRQDSRTNCADTDLFVAGMSRDSGAVNCVRPMTRTIGATEIAKTLRYRADTNSMEFDTVSLKKGQCPPKYVAQQLSPRSFETSPAGTCVYRYQKELPWMQTWPAAAENVSGRFCPNVDYEAVGSGSCSMRIVSQTNGYCPATCTDEKGNSYDCSYSVPPDTSHTIQQSVSGPNVSCALLKTGTQRCGASWTGAVQWSGVCKITVPETLPMGGG